MKSLLLASVLTFLLLAVAVEALRSAATRKFPSLEDEAADFAQLSVAQYIGRLEEALVHDTKNAELAHNLDYYRVLSRHSTISFVGDANSGAVADCVPFELQPALFGASAKEVHEAHANWMQATMGQVSAESVCPRATVPIPRPIVSYGSGLIPKLVEVPQKKAKKNPRLATPSLEKGLMSYSYVDSPNHRGSDGNYTYVVLGLGADVNATLPETPVLNFVDHSINQMWWADFNGKVKTLEAGWIQCSYFSLLPTTTLFVFSTPNGYSTLGSANQYNYKGGFVGYPGAPSIGTSVGKKVQYVLKYEKMKASNGTITGFEMKFTPYTGNAQTGNFTFGSEIAVGYYPVKRYKGGVAPNFHTLQVGQEIDQLGGTKHLQAGGRIFGWGTPTKRISIDQQFNTIGTLNIPFTYEQCPAFSPDQYTSGHSITFHGI